MRQNIRLVQKEEGYDPQLRTPYISSVWKIWDGRNLEVSVLGYGIYTRVDGGIARKFDSQESFMGWMLENEFIELE